MNNDHLIATEMTLQNCYQAPLLGHELPWSRDKLQQKSVQKIETITEEKLPTLSFILKTTFSW